ncbi:putative calcium-binding protein CML28 [Hibiscus syriacus]|uniref:Calcium-binding protein CML28 n=1 Tax=Hibiscus syriacus TaxID=106335 RepID=A0A6A2ZZM5_HIBSY|nr:putative calcium-binding protein CML28 [Hibiscus syriacus]
MDQNELRRVFQMFDRNKDGMITKEGLNDSLENLGLFISDKEVSQIIESIDVNGDGLVDIDEFSILYQMITNEHDEEEDMMEAFNVFDQNRDGFITFDELKSVLSSLGLKQGKAIEDCQKMITKVGADGDGRVNFMVFKQMMKAGEFAALRSSDIGNPPTPVFVPPAPPPNGGNLAGNLHGIEVLSSSSLERSGSPFPDEDQRVTKKVCNKELNDDRMEEVQNGMDLQSKANNIGEGTRQQEKQSYASAVTNQLKQMMDVASLQVMDEVVVLDGECIVDNNGPYPVIQFADQVHDRIDYSMRRSVIVWLLGSTIGFKTLLNWISLLWQLQGQYQVIDLENDYFLVKFESEQDYIHALMEGPWTIFGCYLTIQPWSRTFTTSEKHPSFWKKIEYEVLHQICFQCGIYGHMNDVCGSIESNTSKGGVASGSSFDLDKEVGGEESGFGPWMIVETCRRRTKKNLDPNMKTSGDDTRGSQFAILGEENNGIDEDSAVDKENSSSGLMEAGASRLGYPSRSGKAQEIQTFYRLVTEGKFNTHLDRNMMHGEGSFSLRENRREEGSLPVVGALEIVTEEGTGSQTFRRYLREHCRENRPRIVALLETRISVYASPQVEKHKLVWKHLINLDPGENEAWILGGDFNSIIRLDERDGGSCYGLGVSNLFAEFVFELGLFEVNYRGPKFIWRRGNLCKCLDHCLMNSCWADIFSSTVVLHLDRGNRPFHFIAWNNDMDVLHNINSFQIKANDWNLKLVTKIIVNRLKPLPSHWISETQTSFVPDRSITNNIIIAQDVVHSMRLKRGKIGYMAIKIDIEKTYDHLEWPFIDDTLKEVRILDKLRMLIMRCVSSVSTQVLWNGAMSTSFNPSRGFRQDDPLSPYLFVMCMERLGHALAGALNSGRWKPICLCRNGPALSHLFFADDLQQCPHDKAVGSMHWLESIDQNFSVKSAYELRRGILNDDTHKVWEHRNGRIFDPDYFEHESVLEKSRRLTLEANCAMESSLPMFQFSHRPCTIHDAWQPPPHNWCKINTDRSHNIGSGFASYGGVFRSSNGGWMFGFSKLIGICSIVEAELWGIHEGLFHGWNLGERLITVETDSLDAVRMLKHISRNANKVTDKLAKIAATRGEVHMVFSTPPLEGIDIVRQEAEDYMLTAGA